MRWIPFVILVYLIVLFQTTLGRALTFRVAEVGTIGPDIAALAAVYVAFHARGWADAMLAAWGLGLAIDLTTAGGVGVLTVVGPMPIAYALAGGLLFRVREALFRERALTQALLALAFCLLAHGLWVTAQWVLTGGGLHWPAYGWSLLQVLASACYSALLMPLMHVGLGKCRRWFLPAAAGPGRRMRR